MIEFKDVKIGNTYILKLGTGMYSECADLVKIENQIVTVIKKCTNGADVQIVDSEGREHWCSNSDLKGVELTVGALYRHFKGGFYTIEALAKDANIQADLVVYRALYGDKKVWVRTVEDFLAEVDPERTDNFTGQENRFKEYPEIPFMMPC